MRHINHALCEVNANDLPLTWDCSSQHEKLDACIGTVELALSALVSASKGSTVCSMLASSTWAACWNNHWPFRQLLSI